MCIYIFHTGKWIVIFINSRLFYVIDSYNYFSNHSSREGIVFIAILNQRKV